jgi:hypothetical protein
VAAAALVVGVIPAGASVPAKAAALDPCSLVTDAAVASLSGGWSIEKTDDLSKTNCLVYLQGDGDSGTVNVFVDKPSEYSLAKSPAKQSKSVSGLKGGYVGVVGGDPVVGFKTKSAAVRLTSSAFNAEDLVVLAKAASKAAK